MHRPLFQDCSDGLLCGLLTDYAANIPKYFLSIIIIETIIIEISHYFIAVPLRSKRHFYFHEAYVEQFLFCDNSDIADALVLDEEDIGFLNDNITVVENRVTLI